MANDRTRRPRDARDAAEAAFKKATTKPFELPTAPRSPGSSNAVPNAKELITLRIDREVLDHFQADGPGWQDRINAALRAVAGK